MGTDVREADFVVVGAGLAGLAAARDLTAAGASVVVLEARDRVGGRTLNEDIGDGKVVEVGGQWIGPTQDRLAALAAEVGVDTFPTHTAGENLLERSGRISPLPGHDPAAEPARSGRRGAAQRRLDRMAGGLPRSAVGGRRRGALGRADRRAHGCAQHAHRAAGATLLELGIEAVWAAEPEDLSLLHMLFYIRSAGSLDLLFDTEGGAQEDRFVGGSQLVPLELARAAGRRRRAARRRCGGSQHGGEGVTRARPTA